MIVHVNIIHVSNAWKKSFAFTLAMRRVEIPKQKLIPPCITERVMQRRSTRCRESATFALDIISLAWDLKQHRPAVESPSLANFASFHFVEKRRNDLFYDRYCGRQEDQSGMTRSSHKILHLADAFEQRRRLRRGTCKCERAKSGGV